jgi:precorrin-4 methylase
MIIEITDVTEQQVDRITARLENDGFRYDEDFTTLYGAQWKIVGVRFMGNAVTIRRAVGVAQEVAAATTLRPEFTLPKFGHDHIR